MFSTAIVHPLLEFLSVGDIFRLHRALGKHNYMSADKVILSEVVHRMSLKPRPSHTFTSLSHRMLSRRCFECGVRCRLTPAVCGMCSASSKCFRAMVTRADIRLMIGRAPGKRDTLLYRVWKDCIVKRGRNKAFYYWRRQVLVCLVG
jgi:hypothetical protein